MRKAEEAAKKTKPAKVTTTVKSNRGGNAAAAASGNKSDSDDGEAEGALHAPEQPGIGDADKVDALVTSMMKEAAEELEL